MVMAADYLILINRKEKGRVSLDTRPQLQQA